MRNLLHALWQKTLPLPPNRWRHRHGYGVQSPWAFELVRDVLFEPLRYYAFDRLGGTPRDEQLFRLALWLPTDCLMAKDIGETGRRYLLAARPSLRLIPFDPSRIDEQTVLVVEQIRGANRRLWHERVLPLRGRTSAFDLGDRGLAFFSPARQRCLYYL